MFLFSPAKVMGREPDVTVRVLNQSFITLGISLDMRYSFHLKIRPGTEEEYDKRHASVWDDMKAMLRASGVRNYSIYRDGVDIFGYWECENLAKTLDAINRSSINKRWQLYMDDIIMTPAGERTGIGLMEVFHLD